MDPDVIGQAFEQQATQPEVLQADPELSKVRTDPVFSVGHGEGQQFAGDAAVKGYASHIGGLYQQRLEQLGLGEGAPERRQKLEASVFAKAQKYALDTLAERHEQEGLVGRGGADYWLQKVPFGGIGTGLAHAGQLADASEKFGKGTADAESYQHVAHYLAQEKHDKERGTGGQFVDVLGQLPTTVAEWTLSGGSAPLAQGAVKMGVKEFAKSLATRAGASAFAKQTAVAGAQTVLKQLPGAPLRVGAETYERMSAKPVMGDDGLKFTDPEQFGKAFAKSVAGDVAERFAFGGLDPFNARQGTMRLARMGGLIVAGELTADTKAVLNGAPVGGPLWQLGKAKNGEERAAALKRMAAEYGAFAVFDFGMHAISGKLGAKPTQEGDQKSVDSFLKQAADHEQQTITPPAAPSAPEAADKPRVVADFDPELGYAKYHDLMVGGQKKGFMSFGEVGATSEARAAERMLPGIVQPGEKVSRISGIEIDPDLRGKGLGQQLYLGAMIGHGADWYYNSQTYPPATNALKALARKGWAEVHWEGKEPDWGDKGGIHLVRPTEAGRRAYQAATGERPSVPTLPGTALTPPPRGYQPPPIQEAEVEELGQKRLGYTPEPGPGTVPPTGPRPSPAADALAAKRAQAEGKPAAGPPAMPEALRKQLEALKAAREGKPVAPPSPPPPPPEGMVRTALWPMTEERARQMGLQPPTEPGGIWKHPESVGQETKETPEELQALEDEKAPPAPAEAKVVPEPSAALDDALHAAAAAGLIHPRTAADAVRNPDVAIKVKRVADADRKVLDEMMGTERAKKHGVAHNEYFRRLDSKLDEWGRGPKAQGDRDSVAQSVRYTRAMAPRVAAMLRDAGKPEAARFYEEQLPKVAAAVLSHTGTPDNAKAQPTKEYEQTHLPTPPSPAEAKATPESSAKPPEASTGQPEAKTSPLPEEHAALAKEIDKAIADSREGPPTTEELYEAINKVRKALGRRKASMDELLDAKDALVERDLVYTKENEHGEEVWYKPPGEAAGLDPRFKEGGKAALEAVFDAAGFTPRERHLAYERAKTEGGVVRSHNSIAEDPIMRKKDGSRYTYQRIKQFEQKAIGKLRALNPDLPEDFTFAKMIEQFGAGAKSEAVEKHHGQTEFAKLTAEQQATVRKAHRPLTPEEDVQKQIEQLADEHQEAAEAAGEVGLTDEEREHYASEGRRLAAALEAARRQPEPGADESTPVPAEPAGELPGGAAAPGAGATRQGPEGSPGRPAARTGTEAPGDQLAEPSFKPAGMGLSEPGSPSNPPPSGAPVSSAGPPTPPNGPPTAKPAYQRAVDWLKTVSQQSFPAVTRLARTTGEALACLANVKSYADLALEHFAYSLRVPEEALGRQNVGGFARSVPLAELTPAERKLVGTTFQEWRHRTFRDKLIAEGDRQAADHVSTFVGGQDSPLSDEATYVRVQAALHPFFEAWKGEWRQEVESNFRGIMAMEPDEAIDSRSQIPGLPLNARALKLGEATTPGVVFTTKRGALSNIRIPKAGLTREAGLDAPAYDTDIVSMMSHTLRAGGESARRAEFFRQGIGDGVIQKVDKGEERPSGWPSLETKPAPGLPELPAGSRYYVHPDAEREVRSGLGLDVPASKHVRLLTTAATIINSSAIMAPIEIETHVFNHLRALWAPGMGPPLANLRGIFQNAFDILTHNPEMSREVMDLAKINAAFSHSDRPGAIQSLVRAFYPEAKVGWDPTYWAGKFTGKFIDVMQKSFRVQMARAYDRLAASGDVPNTETGKRDFINGALGNYNSLASNRITQFLKDTGLQPFATAATTGTTAGVRQLAGGIGVTPTSPQAAVRLRATAFAKMIPLFALGPALNALIWGTAFPQGTSAFAIKTGQKDDGTILEIDPLRLVGIRRGARVVGLNAISERVVGADRDSREPLADRIVKDTGHSILHWGGGPITQFVYGAATGENFYGHRIAPKAKAGESQFARNFLGAAANVNQAVGVVTEADRPKRPTTLGEKLNKLAGPFGLQERRPRR